MSETTQDIEHAAPQPAAISNVDPFEGGATPAALQKIAAEAAMLDQVYAYAARLARSPLMPPHYQWDDVPRGQREPRGKQAAGDLAIAIMYGAELGLSAMQSAQNVFPVNGRPSVYARTMVAQVRQHIDKTGSGQGPQGDDIWEVSAEAGKVIWAGRRNGKTASAEWTMERADRAGFTSNPKYQKQPIEMLRAKAMTEVCRILWQDVLLGMAYSVEDLQLEDGTTIQVQRPATRQKGVGGLAAILDERRSARTAPQEIEGHVVEAEPDRHPAEPGPADQSVEPAPVPEQQPIPEPDSVVDQVRDITGDQSITPNEAAEIVAGIPKAREEQAARQEARGGEVNSRGEVLATRGQLAKARKALDTYQKMSDPHAPEALQYMSSLINRLLEKFGDLSGAEADEIVEVLAK